MGTLFYGARRLAINFEDRMLAHLQMVIHSKLRRHEPVMLSWRDDEAVGDGRSSVWIDSHTDLHFKYSGSRFPQISQEWYDALMASANSPAGLQLLNEGTLEAPPGTSNRT